MIEIERKFLISGDGWKSVAESGLAIGQGYLADGDPSIRIRRMGDRGFLTVKAGQNWAARQEYEYEIPLADAEAMLRLCCQPVMTKTRYLVRHGAHLWEIDVFDGANRGFLLAEVELKQADETVQLPPWIGPEVTGDPRFFNAYLAKRPFSTWGVSYDDLVKSLRRAPAAPPRNPEQSG